jgi:hypothetical protein
VVRRVFGQSGHTLSENALFSGILGLFYAKNRAFLSSPKKFIEVLQNGCRNFFKLLAG